MRLFRQSRKIIREVRPNKVITYIIKPNIYGGIACRLKKVPYYVNITGLGSAFQKEDGWLSYHGYQKNVKPFIAACHCFVLPSWHEGMANTNLECAAMGRPVITSDIPGCREAVIDGKSGFLVASRNVESLYQGMKRFFALSDDEHGKMGLAGRKHMEEVFDKKKVVAKTLAYTYN